MEERRVRSESDTYIKLPVQWRPPPPPISLSANTAQHLLHEARLPLARAQAIATCDRLGVPVTVAQSSAPPGLVQHMFHTGAYAVLSSFAPELLFIGGSRHIPFLTPDLETFISPPQEMATMGDGGGEQLVRSEKSSTGYKGVARLSPEWQ